VNAYPLLRVLVAEDNGTYRKLLSAMIERLTGSAPLMAADGGEAWELLQRENFDLVFMDQHMPVMTGVEVTRAVRGMGTSVAQPYVIAVSGSSTPKDLRAFQEAGMDVMLPKPFRLAELLSCLETATGVRWDPSWLENAA
jgi:CheY-like chemotaxis protein